jgi:hypothetical protein
MLLHGIFRTDTLGAKKKVQVAGYTAPSDIVHARAIIKQQYPYARTILFLIPKEK